MKAIVGAMLVRSLAAAGLGAAVALTPAQAQSIVDGSGTSLSEEERAAVMWAVGTKLKDPVSAQFRNVKVGKRIPGFTAVCGEVNARNGYGGYVGFQPFSFIVKDGKPDVMLPLDRSPQQIAFMYDVLRATGC